jgi:CBS domain-containing protein
MQVADIMTHNVISVQPEATILQAAELMLQHRISGLPVVDSDGHVVGIVTEGDFLRRAETGTQRKRARWVEFIVGPGRLAEEYVRSSSRRVEDVMTRSVHTIGEDTPLSDAVELMERHRIKRLPVLRVTPSSSESSVAPTCFMRSPAWPARSIRHRPMT